MTPPSPSPSPSPIPAPRPADVTWGLLPLNKPVLLVSADVTSGPAPLAVHFTATVRNADAVRWDYGDGSAAEGLDVRHTFQAGTYTVTASATNPWGTETTSVTISAFGPAVDRDGSAAD
jgi:PKD repeat protein